MQRAHTHARDRSLRSYFNGNKSSGGSGGYSGEGAVAAAAAATGAVIFQTGENDKPAKKQCGSGGGGKLHQSLTMIS